MLGRFTRHVQGQLVGYIALFIAMGGVSYAAVTLPANSVGTKQLKNGAVTGKKVKPHSLLATNFKAGQLTPGPQGLQGSPGAAGTTGATGAKGDTGAAGTNGTNGTNAATKLVVRRVITPMTIAGGYYTATAPCNAGEIATGGGVSHAEASNAARLVYDAPNSGSPTTPPTDWVGSFVNGASTIDSINVYVLCAS